MPYQQMTINRASTPPPRTATPQQDTGDSLPGVDEEKLRQLAMMMLDIKVVGQQVMLLWHEEISPRAHHSDDVSLEGTQISV